MDIDLAVDDVLNDALDIGLQLIGHLVFEVMIGRKTHAAVGQRAQVVLSTLEVAVHQVGDGVVHGLVHVLQHRRQQHAAKLRRRNVLVRVHANHHHAAILRRCGTPKAHRTSHREDHVTALVEEVLGKAATIIRGLKVAGECAILGLVVPAQQGDVRTVLGVVVVHAILERSHEFHHRRNVDAAIGANHARFAHPGSQITRQEAGLRHVEQQTANVRRLAGIVHNRKSRIGIRFCGLAGSVTQHKAYGDDEVLLLGQELIDVLFVVGLLLTFKEHAFHRQVPHSILDALPRCLVEGLIINAAQVADHAHLEDLLLRLFSLRRFGRLGSRRFGRLSSGRLGGLDSRWLFFCWSLGWGCTAATSAQGNGAYYQQSKQNKQS